MFKTIKAKIIFVTIFSILCIIITFLLIIYDNIDIKEKEEETKQEETVVEKDVSGVDFNGKYNQNDLIINSKNYSEDKIEIEYYQIEGLKNKEIQNIVNKKIEDTALNIYKNDISDINSVENISVATTIRGNFANTLSMYISYYAKELGNSDEFYNGFKTLNFDLTTGEEITIDKLFTSDAPIEDILRNAVYYWNVNEKSEQTLQGNYIVENYGNIEDECAEYIMDYKKGKISQFTFSPIYIYLYSQDNTYIVMQIEDYYEYIAIYNRYLKEEAIFENNNIGLKQIYNFVERENTGFYYLKYEQTENYYIDIVIDYLSEKDEFTDNLINQKIKDIEAEIEKVKQETQKNPKEFYILNYHITVSQYATDETYITYYEFGNSYEMSVLDFEETIEPIIKEESRKMSSDQPISYIIYDFTDVLKIAPQSTIEDYNIETGEKIVV